VNYGYAITACACAISVPCWEPTPRYRPNNREWEIKMRKGKRQPRGKVPVWHQNRPPARLRLGRAKELRLKRTR
jgi:hypothetical protein